jgi:hypothetical protein
MCRLLINTIGLSTLKACVEIRVQPTEHPVEQGKYLGTVERANIDFMKQELEDVLCVIISRREMLYTEAKMGTVKEG